MKLRHTLACRVFLGGGLKNDLESNKKSWIGEAVKLKKNVACRVLEGGGLKHALESWNGDKKSWRGSTSQPPYPRLLVRF